MLKGTYCVIQMCILYSSVPQTVVSRNLIGGTLRKSPFMKKMEWIIIHKKNMIGTFGTMIWFILY